jgi:hypothetical protein
MRSIKNGAFLPETNGAKRYRDYKSLLKSPAFFYLDLINDLGMPNVINLATANSAITAAYTTSPMMIGGPVVGVQYVPRFQFCFDMTITAYTSGTFTPVLGIQGATFDVSGSQSGLNSSLGTVCNIKSLIQNSFIFAGTIAHDAGTPNPIGAGVCQATFGQSSAISATATSWLNGLFFCGLFNSSVAIATLTLNSAILIFPNSGQGINND